MPAEAICESLPEEADHSLQAAMREIDRRLVTEWLAKYREQLEKYDELWKDFEKPLVPTLFEVSFGRAGEARPSIDEPLMLECKQGRVFLSGRIDRIDTGMLDDRTVFNILDYKTGGTIRIDGESILSGLTLQLPLYAIAALNILQFDREPYPWRAGYWYVKEPGFRPKQALAFYDDVNGRIEIDPDWESIREELAKTVVGLASAIRQGRFPVCSADDHCTGRCPYNTICRINQVRSLEKKWRPRETE
jgi:ATP-dependent helicase/DNAse subunit B